MICVAVYKEIVPAHQTVEWSTMLLLPTETGQTDKNKTTNIVSQNNPLIMYQPASSFGQMQTQRHRYIIKERFDIWGNTLIYFLSESQMRKLKPLSCLYDKYATGASSRLAQLMVKTRNRKKQLAWLRRKIINKSNVHK